MTPTEPALDADTPQGSGPGGMSLLTNLRDRRESIAQALTLDKQVPRWSDPSIWVRYIPVDFKVANKARILATSKGDQAEKILLANVDTLIAGCIGVYATLPGVVDDDGELKQFSLRPGDPDGPPTTFDRDLAQNLGLNSEATARQVVRTLFLTDGDILSAAADLAKFSGMAGEAADDELGES